MPETIFKISPEGIKIEGKGFKGRACEAQLEKIKAALADSAVEDMSKRRYKDTYYEEGVAYERHGQSF